MKTLFKFIATFILMMGSLLLFACQSTQDLTRGPATKEMYKCSYKNLVTKIYYYGEDADYNKAGRIARQACWKGPMPSKCLMHYCERIL